MDFTAASEAIAERYVRRFGKGMDGQNVRDHAYRKVNRCITIRMIAGTKETRNTGHRELSSR